LTAIQRRSSAVPTCGGLDGDSGDRIGALGSITTSTGFAPPRALRGEWRMW